MAVSKKLIKELDEVMKEEFDLVLPPDKLEKFAQFLLGYFELLLSLDREKVRKL